MSQKPDDMGIAASWTNGRKALVYLLQDEAGDKVVRKIYRPGFTGTMFREYFALRYVSQLPIVPRVLRFRPSRRELILSYVPGQRVLEWVLERFGATNLTLTDFQSFHGLETDARVAEAFLRFRESTANEAFMLRQAIKESYFSLHRIHMLHGACDPRNLIYDGRRAFIIDFDHARPSINPSRIEYLGLTQWYGISLDSAHAECRSS